MTTGGSARASLALDPKLQASPYLYTPLVEKEKAGFLSQFHYSWLRPFLLTSLNRRKEHKKQVALRRRKRAILPINNIPHHLSDSDIGQIPDLFTSNTSYGKFSSFCTMNSSVNEMANKNSPLMFLHDHAKFSTKFTVYCLKKMVRRELIISAIFKAISEISLLVLPLLLYYFLVELGHAYYNSDVDHRLKLKLYGIDIVFTSRVVAYLLGFAILLISSICSYTSKRSMEILRYAGISIQAALCLAIYKKNFRLASYAKSAFTNGRIFGLVTGDVRRVDLALDHIHVAWLGPLQLILIACMLFWVLGPGAGVGLALMVGSVPVQYLIVRYIAKRRIQTTLISDTRVRFVDQLLSGIRVVAFNDWGEAFFNSAHKLRSAELSAQWSLHVLVVLLITLVNAITIIASLVSFAASSYLSDTVIPTSTVFAALAMFGQLRSAMGTFPPFLAKLIDAKISLRRISEFLRADELAFFNRPKKLEEDKSSPALDEPFLINAQNLWASWRSSRPSPPSKLTNPHKTLKEPSTIPLHVLKSLCSLKEISLSIPKGSFAVIVGPVGAGKSSLIQCILGEMNIICGSLGFSNSSVSYPRLSYCPQVPWIKHGSLRENIVFGSKFNSHRYSTVLSICKLRSDIKHLPLGDLTEIGGSPSPLSGGQKQRIALARALYVSADILLLDDPISALDTKVAKAIWANAFSSHSKFLQGKTRIVSTHSIHLIPNSCDWLIQMESGRIKWQGPPEEWNHPNGPSIYELGVGSKDPSIGPPQTPFAISSTKTVHHISPSVLEKTPIPGVSSNELIPNDTNSLQDDESIFAEELMELGALESSLTLRKGSRLAATGYDDDTSTFGNSSQQSIAGSLPFSLYLEFLKRFGWFFFALALVLLVALQWSRIATERELAQSGSTFLDTFIWTLSFIFVISIALSTLLIATGALRATRSVYSDAFSMITCAPLSFFDQFPLGQLLSRLTRDTECSDYDVLDAGRDFLGKAFAVGSILALVAITMPGALGIALPVVLTSANWLILRLYHTPMLDLERLSSRARSAYLQQVSDTLAGVQVIRAFSTKESDNSHSATSTYSPINSAYQANCKRLDRFVGPSLLLASLQSWASLRFELVANGCVAATALFCVWANVSPIIAGLVIHQLMGLAKSIYTSIVSFADLELALCSVQRLLELSNIIEDELIIPKEAQKQDPYSLFVNSSKPTTPLAIYDAATWPFEGSIEFKNVTVKYTPQGRPVLCDINLEIKPGERVAIIGRTGSGKSTLIQALFGLIPLAEGSIKIDDVDISMISGSMLRQRLAIIPQDPVIFYGTSLRFNLDPMCLYSDEAIWASLETVSVASPLRQLLGDDALNVTLREGTAILSQGQSQLVCLARALLKKSRVLVLDEATANVDIEMDSLIQETIRKASFRSSSPFSAESSSDGFSASSCTVITIAHRLLSILDYDRIVVLQDGFISEVGSPASLISNTNSLFTQLVKELGEAEYNHILAVLLNSDTTNL